MESVPSLKRKAAVTLLIKQAYTIVDRKYGPDGQNPKAYHNGEHARDVAEATKKIADFAVINGKIDESEKDLAVIAAAYHDIEQDLGRGENERASAEIAAQKMTETGKFKDSEIQKVKNCIMATAYNLDDGRITQSATEDNYLAQIVADADLANLGKDTDNYWDRSLKFFRETHPGIEPVGEALIEYTTKQLVLLDNHKFYTREAEGLYNNRYQNRSFTEKIRYEARRATKAA